MRRKDNLLTMSLIFLFIAGMSLLLYPTVAELWNKKVQTKAIVTYTEKVAEISDSEYESVRQLAEEYNRNIQNRNNIYSPSEEEQKLYEDLLNINGNGQMGYIQIPSIGVLLPVYHGVNDHILQVGVGHLEWTALPVGGEGTHCVLSGHRGLPSSRLFTDLDKVKEGDTFSLHVLDEIYTYEVDQILTVLPEETKALLPVEGMDLCTLVTCTPYGINTHRLLVRGHRIPTPIEREKLVVSSEAMIADRTTVAVFVAVPVLLLLFVLALLIRSGKKTYKKTGSRRERILWDTEEYVDPHKNGYTTGRKKGGAHLK